ncbi:FadR/GntR family transcriptional regulator [Virgibacillus halodenitrificans]|jgi:GntR family transcriptional regulator, transcriptional repressor for pyruvate dehydrogenase complex|uniref:GntR family transcriptional regulator n=1 Tax=Virgibacillus halodenitrificans TaxID=1482 RepID=A0AAC9NKX1_VIRHA|nr:GntR family transcriptional regulator [Virgibacillus halodenitrificans]APC48041.1 GntR family transcriptional regulator [Virgibacillus halodenitrificans]MEC2159867.1 GntR family transcriptional regulator [Virgibacillus halodenitrificans]CDQ36978.1 L-lactate utilization operon repressor [Virgibacillus halodenitrificans]
MAVPMSPKQKVYQEILQEIRKFIDHHDLKPGDKLPSERELADRLQAGRSSIREALRAMELLGLIETKHGEGTFISTYRPYQTVEILSSFILQGNGTKKDLLISKRIIEKECAKLAYKQLTEDDLQKMESLLTDSKMSDTERHTAFFTHLAVKTDNLLMQRIWQLMDEFSVTMPEQKLVDSFYVELVDIYKRNVYMEIENLFEKYTCS